MKNWVLSLLVLLLPASAGALEKVAEPKLKEAFADNIRAQGYRCSACRDVYIVGEDSRGVIYRVICVDNVRSFTVIVVPGVKFIVKPW